jgi:hypothetical protein
MKYCEEKKRGEKENAYEKKDQQCFWRENRIKIFIVYEGDTLGTRTKEIFY